MQVRNHIQVSVVKNLACGNDSSKREKTTKKELKKNNKITMDFIWEGLPKPVRERLENVHQPKNFGISYMTYIIHPSQIQKMPKKMQIQNKKKDVYHVRQIQKRKSMMK
jgi:hypothetical protein